MVSSYESPLNKIIKPSDCVIASGFPFDEILFNKSQIKGEFVSRFLCWDEYKDRVISEYQKLQVVADNYNLSIHHYMSLEGIRKLFRSRYHLVVLVSHWSNDKIELREGMVSQDRIAKLIPQKFNGIVDICACNPSGFSHRIKEQAPSCNVSSVDERLNLPDWLNYYTYFFSELIKKDCNYMDAAGATVRAFSSWFYEQQGDSLRVN